MNILVLGTSNSIMKKGWLSLSREEAARNGIFYCNQSIGAAPLLYLPYRLNDLALLDGIDRVVIDFCINDQMFMDSGTYGLARVRGHYLAAFRQLAERGMLDKSLVLLLVQKHFVEANEACPLIEMLQSLCDQYGVAILSAEEVLTARAVAQNEPRVAAFADPRHYTPEYQHEIGLAVAQRLQDMPENSNPRVTTHRAALKSIPCGLIRPLNIAVDKGLVPKKVGTSLAKRTVFSLDDGTLANVTGAEWLWGMFFWTHDAAGAFCLQGCDEERRFHLRRGWKDLFMIDAFKHAFRLGEVARLHAKNDETVNFEVLQAQNSSVYDCTDATLDIVDLIGSDLSPTEFNDLATRF